MKWKKVKSKVGVSKSDSCDGYLIESSEKEARRIIESLKGSGKRIGVVGGDDAFNRRAVESLRIDYLVSAERVQGKDSLKQRDSGINHVVAKEMAKRGVVLVVDFAEIAGLRGAARGIPSREGTKVPSLSGKAQALRLERVIQNIKICRKAKCRIEIWGSEDKKALVSFGVSLGMSSSQAAEVMGNR